MSLEEYQARRHFDITSEPEGKSRSAEDRHQFVIQKHAASRLHYDFRLEMEGVLKSWAVPKGPSCDPKDRRLAVHVEDHPVEYAGFEGIIPKGQYGGGTVMLWDRGTWEPLENPHKTYRQGKLKFRLNGHKLQGVWNLVRTGSADDNSWLLFKEKDEFARPHDDFDVTRLDRSVASGRSMDEIAANADTVWQSNRNEFSLEAGKEARMPQNFKPMLATLVEKVPEDQEWLHEIKYDGYRLLARVEGGHVQLITRGNQDWTSKFPTVARALLELPVRTALLDGEVVVLNPDGTNNFQQLQNIMKGQGEGELIYYVFDLPYCQDRDLRDLPLIERKEILQTLLAHASEPVRYSSHILGNGPLVLENACKLGCEGVISKRIDSTYTGKRSYDWLKSKCLREEEFVVVGFSKGEGTREGFGSLLLAQFNEQGELRYAGRVGTGFNTKMLKQMRAQLEELRIDSSPLSHSIARAESRGVTWVKPERVARVGYSERTQSGILRHPRFHGERLDKKPAEVKPEKVRLTPGTLLSQMRISNPDRIIDQDSGLTKMDLALYYEAVGPRIMAHIARRPLTVVRCPGGTAEQCFYQKHVKDGFPDTVKSIPIEEEDGVADYIMVDQLEGLLALVQMGGLEFHPWGSSERHLDQPDRLVFDLDPDEGLGWDRVIEATLEVRDQLRELGLESFCKTSGGKGLHVVVPLRPRLDWEQTKAFCKAFAEKMAREAPKKYTSVMSKERRKGKIFLDYLRNGKGATSVATYSARARSGLPISVPLDWSEVTPQLDPKQFTIASWPQRAELDEQLWRDFTRTRQSITQAMVKKVSKRG